MADKKYKASAKCDKNTRKRRLRKWTGQTRPLRGGGEKYREQAESGEIGQLCISREIGRATEEMTTQVPRLAREEESLPPFRQECWLFIRKPFHGPRGESNNIDLLKVFAGAGTQVQKTSEDCNNGIQQGEH